MDDKRLHWHAEIAGKDKEWDAEIYRQEPDQAIAWRSTSGAQNGGEVRFSSAGGDRHAQVTLVMSYDPEGVIENVGDALGAVSMRVQGDLNRFKEFIESRGRETGGWRGEIRGGSVLGRLAKRVRDDAVCSSAEQCVDRRSCRSLTAPAFQNVTGKNSQLWKSVVSDRISPSD